MNKTKTYISITLLVILMISCKVKYSFSGADIDPNINTVSISYFENGSNNGPANMSDLFTNSLREKILTQTGLILVSKNADIEFSGQVSNYYYTVQAPTGTETSDIRRITMAVNVKFTNNVNDAKEEQWEKTFQSNAEHDVNIDLSSIEEESLRIINNLLVDEIFDKAFVKW